MTPSGVTEGDRDQGGLVRGVGGGLPCDVGTGGVKGRRGARSVGGHEGEWAGEICGEWAVFSASLFCVCPPVQC